LNFDFLACPLHSKFTRSFKEDKSATAGRLKKMELLHQKRFFRPDEAAAILVISRRTVYRMIRDGRIPGVKWGCGPWRIPRESLASLLPGEKF
jgi:excisionase family DNA binding protein